MTVITISMGKAWYLQCRSWQCWLSVCVDIVVGNINKSQCNNFIHARCCMPILSKRVLVYVSIAKNDQITTTKWKWGLTCGPRATTTSDQMRPFPWFNLTSLAFGLIERLPQLRVQFWRIRQIWETTYPTAQSLSLLMSSTAKWTRLPSSSIFLRPPSMSNTTRVALPPWTKWRMVESCCMTMEALQLHSLRSRLVEHAPGGYCVINQHLPPSCRKGSYSYPSCRYICVCW